VGIVALLAAGARCQGNPSVSFEILLPSSVADQAQWMEIGVLPGACLSSAQLGGGVPTSGTVARVAFQKGDTDPPAVGDLAKASYGFAAAARGADCSVLATGCSLVDVTHARDVSIPLTATTTPVGACSAGETCDTGRCIPSLAPGAPSLGAGCSMQLVGAGPLGDPLELSGSDVASAPAVAVTESGFLVGYREYDPGAGVARVTAAAVDAGGGITIGAPATLPSQCPSQDESDALGLAYLGGAGVIVSARPACSGQAGAGMDLLAVDPEGNVQMTSSFQPTAAAVTLSNAHAAALTAAGAGWIALVDQGAASVVGLSGLTTQGKPLPFVTGPGQVLAEVAATDRMVALLAGDGSTLRLQLGAGPSDAGVPYATAGTWGAVAAQNARAYVLGDGGGGSSGGPLVFQAYDLGGSAVSFSGSFTPPGQGAAVRGDVALQGDRVAFAVEQPGSISVVVYDHASTTPTSLRSVLLSDDPRVPAQTNVRDGRLAIAMSDTRLLVAWLTATDLGPDDPVGGYALYACAP